MYIRIHVYTYIYIHNDNNTGDNIIPCQGFFEKAAKEQQEIGAGPRDPTPCILYKCWLFMLYVLCLLCVWNDYYYYYYYD